MGLGNGVGFGIETYAEILGVYTERDLELLGGCSSRFFHLILRIKSIQFQQQNHNITPYVQLLQSSIHTYTKLQQFQKIITPRPIKIFKLHMSTSSNLKPQKQKQLMSIMGNKVKPVILQLDEQANNQSLIKKMIKNNNSGLKYGGGYRNNVSNVSSHVGPAKKTLYRPDQQQDLIGKQTNVYEQLGLSKAPPKYRVIDQNSKITSMEPGHQYTAKDLQSKIELLKQDRNQRNNHILTKMDSYTLADTKSRFQNVTHAQSSLDVLNLQNIEAKLEAHRRQMRQIEQQYNAKKGKATPIDRYGYMKVNIDVDKEYAELDIDKEQVYELVRKREEMGEQRMEFEELWEMKKRNDPKLAEYDAKYQEYKVAKDAKSLIGNVVRKNLFTWDKYKQPQGQNKSKTKHVHRHSQSPSKQHQQQHSHEHEHAHDLSKSKGKPDLNQLTINRSKYGPDGLQSVKDLQDIIAKKDDKFMASYIFTQLDTDKIGLVSKEQLHDYLIKQEFILNGYNIDTKWLYTDLDNFETKRKGMLNRAQLAVFLATLQKLQHPKLSLTNKSSISSPAVPQATSFTKNSQIATKFPKYKPIFQKLFNTLDFNDDKLIKRAQFIENIYVDSDCVRVLDEEVIRIEQIGKGIRVRQIVGFIMDDYEKERNQKLKKSKQYITFNRFCQYFDIPQSLDLRKLTTTSPKTPQSTESQTYDLPPEYLQLLHDIFNQQPRIYQEYITCADFIQAALRDPQILAIEDQLCRIASVETGLPVESLGTVLRRMQAETDEYGTWGDLRGFFSRRGRPLEWDYELIKQKKEIRQKRMKEERSSISKSKLRETQKYFQLADQLKNKSKEKMSKIPNKYTVPQPFDITDMKQKPHTEYLQEGQKQFEELKKGFKAQPVNQEILEPKPELIAGKVKKDNSQKKIQYKYENYENDRIQRALKRAQQEYEKAEKLRELKEKTEVKATEIGIDLTKKYQDVIKQQQRKKRQGSKYKPTQPKASESLYPKDPASQKAKKIQKVKQNLQKAEQIAKRKNQILEQDKRKAREKNQQVNKLAEQAKRRQREEEKKRDEIATGGMEFKPKINKKQMSQEEREAIRLGREERNRKKKEQDQLKLKMLQDRKKKILQYEKKSNFIPIDGLTDDEILQKLDQINFQDLLLDQNDKNQYRKQFDNTNKTRKQLKDRQNGQAGRQRASMQQQQRRILEQKRLYKQKLQKQKTAPKQNYSKISGKGQRAAYENDLNFHRSNALRRYRAIMENKEVLSEFDKYSVKGSVKGGGGGLGGESRILPEEDESKSQQIEEQQEQQQHEQQQSQQQA